MTDKNTFEALKVYELVNLRSERRKAVELYETKRPGFESNNQLRVLYDELNELIEKMDAMFQANVEYAVAQIEERERRGKANAADEKRLAKLKAAQGWYLKTPRVTTKGANDPFMI